MNKHLQERIEAILARYHTVTLATGGQAGPQISDVSYQAKHLRLYLFIPRSSDHLFNLETQPEVALLTPAWRLHGRMIATDNTVAPHDWQRAVLVEPIRLHILSEDGQNTLETIDF